MSAFTAAMHRQGCAITTRLVVPPPATTKRRGAAAHGSIKPGDPTDNAHRVRSGDLAPATGCSPTWIWRSTRAASSPAAAASRRPAEGILHRAHGDRASHQRRPVAREEIFGPVLTVIAHDGDDDAVRIANDSPYGLSGTVFSADPDRGAAAAGSDAGRHRQRQRRCLVRR